MAVIYFNGKIVPTEQVNFAHDDRGVLLADGLFETLKAYQGLVFCLKEHWQRLTRGAECLNLPLPITYEELEKAISNLLKQNELFDKVSVIRLTVTRGSGPRGLLPPSKPTPMVMMVAFPSQLQELQSISAHIVQIRRNEFSPLSNIKSLSYLDNVLAKQEAVKNGADEAILLNTQGNIAEASAANIFMVMHQSELVTPKLEDGALSGVTRNVVIEICKELGLRITERSINRDEIFSAQEMLLTNTAIEIKPVIKVNASLIGMGVIGQITQQLLDAYQKRIPRANTGDIQKVAQNV